MPEHRATSEVIKVTLDSSTAVGALRNFTNQVQDTFTSIITCRAWLLARFVPACCGSAIRDAMVLMILRREERSENRQSFGGPKTTIL